MSRKSCSDGTAGFTLIEALVALAIVAVVLSSIAAVIATMREGHALDRPSAWRLTGAAETLLAELPSRNLLKPGRQSGELAGHRWRIDVSPMNAAAARDAPQNQRFRSARRQPAAAGAGRTGHAAHHRSACAEGRRMNAPLRRRLADEAGFTLIEVLVATLLMTVILAALATVTAQWLPNWNRGMARVQRAERLALGLDRIVADLSVAEMVPINGDAKVPLFEGSELAVTFVRTAVGPNTRPGLEIIRLVEKADSEGLALVRERAPFSPTAVAMRKSASPIQVVLIRSPFRVTFSYAGPDQVWQPDWRGQMQLPDKIRIAVRNSATGQLLGVSSATARSRQRLGRMRAGEKCGGMPECAPEAGRPEEGGAALTAAADRIEPAVESGGKRRDARGFIVVAVLWILAALSALVLIYLTYVTNTARGCRPPAPTGFRPRRWRPRVSSSPRTS